MIQLQFTLKDIDQLYRERTTHPHPRVRQMMEVLYLKALGLPHQEICRITRIQPTTLRDFIKMAALQPSNSLISIDQAVNWLLMKRQFVRHLQKNHRQRSKKRPSGLKS